MQNLYNINNGRTPRDYLHPPHKEPCMYVHMCVRVCVCMYVFTIEEFDQNKECLVSTSLH